MYEQMLLRRQYLNSEIEKCLKVIKNSPEGKFYIAKDRQYTKWYISMSDGTRKYVTKSDIKTAAQMSRKRIYQEKLDELLQEKYAVELFLNHCKNPADSFVFSDKSSPYFSLVPHLLSPCESRGLEWQNASFESNPYYPEEKIHSSPTGRLLRSKSEVFIDMELASLQIPNRYECRLTLNGEDIFPDFTILKVKTGEKKYWEHFGLMDDPRYSKKAFLKLDEYIKEGIIPGDNLICTFETKKHPLPYPEIRKKVREIKEWIDL